jgi:hypothetical protein
MRSLTQSAAMDFIVALGYYMRVPDSRRRRFRNIPSKIAVIA